MKEIILASASPRRKELLEKMGIKFTISPSDHEESFEILDSPKETVMALAYQKAQEVARRSNEGAIIISADTIVYKNGILGKPKSAEEAFTMLKKLSGQTHYVYTGISVVETGTQNQHVDFEVTQIRFKELSDEKIEKYIDECEVLDKAGAYGIQGKAACFIDHMSGDFFNVMGLPVSKLETLLERYFDISFI